MQYEIFRAGKRKDAHGTEVNITVQDLQQVANAYNANFHEAPLVIGHPTHNAPAFGWVEKLSVQGDVLTADFKQVDDGLMDLVRQGKYKKVSASFYPPTHSANPVQGSWYLRHVGFLGAAAPAVKGLAAIEFADDEAGVVVFSEDFAMTQNAIARTFRRLREWIIGKDGMDAADQIIPAWQIGEWERAATQPEVVTPDFNEMETKETDMATEQELVAEKAAREKAEQVAAQAQAELAKLQAAQEQALRDASHQQNTDFAEQLVKQGSLKPADKNLMIRVLDYMEYPEHHTADFSENGKTTPLADAFKAFLQNGATILADGEHATANRASKKVSGSLHDFAEFAEPEAQSHHERIVALMQKENITYEDAARRTVA
ncbi:2-oxoacid:acceptor oxidoreductase [Kingella kingae]|uniref:2-oxoacid:acceptor oxidoreductase n=1 Tax=Kingella kingae TaxID=504 RepID=UPI00254BF28B|nr:2-oxoacid:acceptor oxidoreductase [Kingella kingae]MDK4544764.1 2-oxoacid:acceptor oxidoreductase [Kingella kingae]MDK4566847.1 2-oxoacid:acceptor oxidoreductase [Kingella kingae]MDK4589836.1 2-oxoacid:acceptor oxidoreductase [Kingella kingae]MDK4628528.1 2-oxoacid:acceptor oxidoreductase [Kingella kingae]MDK4636406.1 2-oxoacid:acceptor oxidoreductase [Kingella kingae]